LLVCHRGLITAHECRYLNDVPMTLGIKLYRSGMRILGAGAACCARHEASPEDDGSVAYQFHHHANQRRRLASAPISSEHTCFRPMSCIPAFSVESPTLCSHVICPFWSLKHYAVDLTIQTPPTCSDVATSSVQSTSDALCRPIRTYSAMTSDIVASGYRGALRNSSVL
jgi:hypothetical protein